MDQEVKIGQIEFLKKEIEKLLFELAGLSHMAEMLLTDVDLEQLKRNRFDAGVLFSVQKRLYESLNTTFYDFTELIGTK
jgi:hypothetical protein